MNKPDITQDKIVTLCDKKFLKFFDIQYAEGRHYFEATRRSRENLVAIKSEEELKNMLPDAVTVSVVLHVKNEKPKLLMSYEFRYPVAQYMLSPVAGLIDPEDIEGGNPLITSAIREINEETGIVVRDTDKITVLNPCSFTSPGMTDESNAFLRADIYRDDISELNHDGAVGGELFGDFVMLDREAVKEIYKTGRDSNGAFFSLETWVLLADFLLSEQ